MAGNNRLRTLIGAGQRIGLGGEGVLRTEGREPEAIAVLSAAYDYGIRYFDSAPAYAGSEHYQGFFWKQYPERKRETFQAGKSAKRDGVSAGKDLARTLSRMERDPLGLWQIHDVRDEDDIRQLEAKGGALRTFYDARETGAARGVGVTGHHDPAFLLHAVTNWDVDAVLLPVNPVEAVIGGFLDKVIPAARERGIGVIGMKALGAGQYLDRDRGFSAENLIRFALSQDVDLVIVGCSTPGEVLALSQFGKEHAPMDDDEQAHMIETVRPSADRLAYYRGVI